MMKVYLQRFKSIAFLGLTFLLTMFSLVAQAQVIVQVGTGTGTQGAPGHTPYSTNWEDGKVQYLVTKSELNALGVAD